MNIITPYAKLMDVPTREIGIKLLQKIEWANLPPLRRCAGRRNPGTAFIRAVVLGHGDWSIVEHVSATADFLVDRGITHELVRHRLFSFTQESTRFVNYEKKKMPAGFIKPEFSQPQIDQGARIFWEESINEAEAGYRRLIGCNVAPQIARSVFPNALASRIIITGNLRNWRHFLLMRTTKEAHPTNARGNDSIAGGIQDAIRSGR